MTSHHRGGILYRTIVLILIFYTIKGSNGAPQPQNSENSIETTTSKSPTHAKILRQINKVNDDGSYTYGYEADDGSFKVETRNKDGVVKGKYGFIDANGELKTIEYSAGLRASTTTQDPNDDDVDEQTITSATATDSQVVKPRAINGKKQTYKQESDRKSQKNQNYSEGGSGSSGTSGEEENDESGDGDNTGSGSNENGSASNEESAADADFDSFGPKKESNGPSELSKRQGEIGDEREQQQGKAAGPGPGQYGNGGFGQAGPTTHLQGGQFRGPNQPQYVDPRYQQGGPGGPHPGAQGFIPQNPSGFLSPYQQQQQHPGQIQYQPQQRPIQYIQGGAGAGPGGLPPQGGIAQQPYQSRPVQGNPQGPPQGQPQLGQYYPDYFSPHFSHGQSGQISHPQSQPQYDDEQQVYIRGQPQQYFSPQYQSEGPPRPNPAYPSSQQYQGFGRPVVQHGGPIGQGPNSFNQYPAAPIHGPSGSTKDKGSSSEDYTPSIELDGFSDDVDQDGFVDPFPGSGPGGNVKPSQVQNGGKVPSKSPEGQRVQGPQIQVQPGLFNTRPIYHQQPQGISPYNEQELQQIYPGTPGSRPGGPGPQYATGGLGPQYAPGGPGGPGPQYATGRPGGPAQQGVARPQSYPTGPGGAGQYYSQPQPHYAPQGGPGGLPQYYDGQHHPGAYESPAYFPQEHFAEGPSGYYPGPGGPEQYRFNSPFGGGSAGLGGFSPYSPGYPVAQGPQGQYPGGGPGGVIPGQAVQLTPTPGAVTIGGRGNQQQQQQSQSQDSNKKAK